MADQKEKAVRVVITGTHKRPGISHIEDTKSEATGRCRKEGDTYLIEYEEYLEEDVKNTPPDDRANGWQGGVATYNLVEVSPSSMRVTRRGSVDSVLFFEQGKEHVSEYRTPFGAMKSRVSTTRYATYSLEKGNRLIAEAAYTVSMNGMEMSDTTMRIDVTFT